MPLADGPPSALVQTDALSGAGRFDPEVRSRAKVGVTARTP